MLRSPSGLRNRAMPTRWPTYGSSSVATTPSWIRSSTVSPNPMASSTGSEIGSCRHGPRTTHGSRLCELTAW
jgi:hypothetical protein